MAKKDKIKNLTSSKLFRLKEWLTVPETARHLSIMFGEEVNESDVLRLGLDGHLKLSVNFVNHAKAKPGEKFLTPKEWGKKFRKAATWENATVLVTMQNLIAIYFFGFDPVFYHKDDELINEGPWGFPSDDRLKISYLSKMSKKKQGEVLESMIEEAIIHAKEKSENFHGKVPPSSTCFEGDVITIKGVWDLAMLGTERLDVEHKYQMLTNGPEITLTGLDGACVIDEDGVVWQLQDRFDEEYIKGFESEGYKKKSLEFYANHLKKRVSNNEIDEKEAEGLLEQRREDLEKPREYDERFYPGDLPDDCVLVVRTKAIREFEQSMSEKTQMEVPAESIKDSPKAVTSLLKMIIAMAVTGYGYNPLSSRSPIPAEIVKDVEKLGLSIDADTIRKWLKEGTELIDQEILNRS